MVETTTQHAAPFDKPEIINNFLEYSALGLELAGVTIIIGGAIYATTIFVKNHFRKDKKDKIHQYRAQLGLGILLGLEFLVAADIVGTVAVSPTWRNVGVLAVIVLIRTFLSMALEIEINGRLPWKHQEGK